jgi:tRNA threonylcarbamoyladenosine biosynthesis protein TsaB
MNLLAIETSSTALSIAVQQNDSIQSLHVSAPMQQAQLILSSIEKLIKNTELKQLDAIAFGCGPGSFTGVRIATSVAQGLGFAANVPLIPISSLAALAQTAYQQKGWKRILTAVDARIHEVYWAAYQIASNGLAELKGLEKISRPEDILPPDNEEWSGVGNAWEVYSAQIKYQTDKKDEICLATAEALLVLARAKFEQGDLISPGQAMPTYLRDQVATKSVR